MKAINVLIAALLTAFHANAADILTERLQRGLFEEEANHNLNAAIKEYQSVVAQSDEQRKVTATALFRLGECYRKLGRTNEANAQYQRILRDFSDQEQLVRLANDLTSAQSVSVAAGSESEYVRALRQRLASLRVGSLAARMEAERQAQQFPTNDAISINLQSQLLAAEQKLTTLKVQFADEHPEVKAATALRQQIAKQLEERRQSAIEAARRFADSLASQVSRFEAELKKVEAGETTGTETASAPGLTQAESEELARMKALAQNSPDLLNTRYKDGLTPLQFAAREGFSSVVGYLLSQGVSIDTPSQLPPLVIAAERGHLRIVEMLIEKGAEKNAKGERTDSGGGIYFSGERTALMRAASKGFKSIVELLIARGADVNTVAGDGMTALHAAAHSGQAAIVELLLKSGSRTDGRITQSISDLRGGSYGGTPLHLAALSGFANVAELLLKNGANVSTTNLTGETPLHLAAKVGHTNVTALLLAKGAEVNEYAADGNTPLTFAIRNNQPDEIEFLLRNGADPNLSTTNGFYPIHLANQPGTMRALLAAKPYLQATNRYGYTAVPGAIRNAPVLQLLLEAGANPNPNVQPPVLLSAVVEGNKAATALLLKHGVNPNVVDADNRTPFSIASDNCKHRRTRGQINYTTFCEIAELLREHGANPELHRQGGIHLTRQGGSDMAIFSRGTNDVNRYTLLELIAAAYQDGGVYFPFPDFAKVEIRRNSDGNPQTNRIDVAGILAQKSCTNDLWLQWGDSVEIPMKDHPAQESWRALSNAEAGALAECLRRTVRINFAGTETNVTLYPRVRSREYNYGASAAKWGGLSFRLSNVVQEQPLLRASSDLRRVKVIRADQSTGQKREMLFDVTQVGLPHMTYPVSPPLSWEHDLWLRDGDVIEIPEKQ